jgi:tRNA threonylcarbamoyl adenosine modification protein YjeE
MTILSHSENDTTAEATKLARNLKPGALLLLRGTLGSGKTVFARSLIRTLTGDASLEVPSPTFTLVQTYDSAKGPIYHFDLYRLKSSEEIYELGWEEALSEGIVIVEWPERLEGLAIPAHLDISFAAVENSPEQRRIEFRHET